MKQHPLGTTGLHVTPIGLGMAALGRPGYINLGHGEDLPGDRLPEELEGHAHEVLDAAFAAGVRYFDAARSYGRGEAFLGRWLRHRGPAPEVVVASKWGYTYTADWRVDAPVHEVKEHTLAVLERQWSESRANLGDSLDLYQIHSATLDSGVLDNAPVLERLARLKAGGTAVGLTLSGPRQGETLARAVDIRVDGVPLFDVVQATWNLLEPSAGPALAEARAGGVGVVIKEALANGRLTERNTTPDSAPALALLGEEAARRGASVDALALAAVLARPWVDVVLSGAATVDQLRANLAALDVPWDEGATTTLARLAEDPDAYWNTRARLPWN